MAKGGFKAVALPPPDQGPAAGAPAPGPTAPVQLLSPDGSTLHTIQPDEYHEAIRAGYKPASQDVVDATNAEAAAKEKYEGFGSQLATGAEGALEGATFGLGPAIEHEVGGVSAEDIKQRAARNPLAHGGGELAGMLAPALFTGGASAAAEGTEAAAATIGGKVLGSMAKGAALNAAFETGHQISEADLGDPQEVASHALGSIGMSALLGAGAGGLFGLGEHYISAGLAKATDAAEEAASHADQAVAMAKAGQTPVEGLDAIARKSAKTEQAAYDAVHDEIADTMKNARGPERASLLNTVKDEDIDQVAREFREKSEAVLANVEARKTLYPAQNFAEGTRDVLTQFDKDFAGATTKTAKLDAIDDAKSSLEQALKTGSNPSDAAATTINELDKVRQAARSAVRDTRFGLEGERRGALDDALSKLYTAEDNSYSALGVKTKQVNGRTVPEFSANKFKTFYKNAAVDSTGADIASNARDALHDAQKNVLDQLQETHKNAGTTPMDMSELEDMFQRRADLTKQGLAAANPPEPGPLAKLAGTVVHRGIQAAVGAAGHAVLPGSGEILGALGVENFARGAGEATARALSGPTATLVQQQTLAKLARLSADGTQAIQSGVKAFMGGRGATAAVQTLKPILAGAPEEGHKRGQDSYTKRVQEWQTLNDPTALSNHLQRKLAGVSDAAPNVSIAMSASAARAVQYMNNLIPPKQGDGDMLSEKQYAPPGASDRLEEAQGVIDKPLSVLKAMRSGSLTANMVGALKAVHPEAYQQIQDTVARAIADKPDRELTITQESQLSTLLGRPVRASYGPAFAQFAQASYAPPPPPQPQGSSAKGGSGASHLTVGQSSQTEQQRLDGRGSSSAGV